VESETRLKVFLDKITTREKYLTNIYNTLLYVKNNMKLENKSNNTIANQLLSYYWMKVIYNKKINNFLTNSYSIFFKQLQLLYF